MAAEDSLMSLEIPEKTKAFGPHMRRNSLGSASASSYGESILPHYLRASTGSCHDFCKYGRESEFDVKARYSTLKRVKEGSVLLEKQKMMPPAKPLLTSRSFDSGEKIRRSKSMIAREIQNDGKKTLMGKTLTSISLKISKSNDPKAKRLESSSLIGKEVSLKKLMLKGREIKLPAKVDTFLRTKSDSVKVKSLVSTDSKEETRPQRNRDVKMGKISGTSNAAASKKVLSSPSASLSPKFIGRNASTRRQNSLKVASPRVYRSKSGKDESNQLQYEEVEEKTLYVIKMETEKKPQIWSRNEDDEFNFPLRTLLPSPKSSSLPNSSSLSHSEGGDRDEVENTANETKEGAFSDIDDKKSEDTDKKGSSEKMDSPQLSKLNLSRGKVVEIQSQTNSPRKLIFRRARLFGDNQKNGDVRRRKWKKVEEVDCKTTDAKPSAEKVILRHQDMRGKKDSQGLFNKVIKETASKLVETRKSKVKALVGAFETVISLQEIKPSSSTGS